MKSSLNSVSTCLKVVDTRRVADDFFCMINDEHLNWMCLRIQFEPQLFRHSCQDGSGRVRCPVQGEIVNSLESSFVLHEVTSDFRQYLS